MKDIILPQIVSVGIYNAQIAIKNKLVSNNRKTTMFEIELPISDGGTSYIDNTSHTISENIIICAKPGQMRHTKLPFMCYYIHMIINDGPLFDILSSLPNYIDLSDTCEIKEIFTLLREHYDTGIPENDILLQNSFTYSTAIPYHIDQSIAPKETTTRLLIKLLNISMQIYLPI